MTVQSFWRSFTFYHFNRLSACLTVEGFFHKDVKEGSIFGSSTWYRREAIGFHPVCLSVFFELFWPSLQTIKKLLQFVKKSVSRLFAVMLSDIKLKLHYTELQIKLNLVRVGLLLVLLSRKQKYTIVIMHRRRLSIRPSFINNLHFQLLPQNKWIGFDEIYLVGKKYSCLLHILSSFSQIRER